MITLQAIDLLSGLLAMEQQQEVTHHDSPSAFSKTHLGRLYVFSLMWSVGALLELDDRAKMEEFIVEMVSKYNLLQSNSMHN